MFTASKTNQERGEACDCESTFPWPWPVKSLQKKITNFNEPAAHCRIHTDYRGRKRQQKRYMKEISFYFYGIAQLLYYQVLLQCYSATEKKRQKKMMMRISVPFPDYFLTYLKMVSVCELGLSENTKGTQKGVTRTRKRQKFGVKIGTQEVY